MHLEEEQKADSCAQWTLSQHGNQIISHQTTSHIYLCRVGTSPGNKALWRCADGGKQQQAGSLGSAAAPPLYSYAATVLHQGNCK